MTTVVAGGHGRNLNVPNALTLLRLVLVPVLAWLLVSDAPWARLGAFAVFVVGSFTDYVDGLLARRWGMVTDFGKLADPIADKAFTGTALIGLSLLGELTWWATVIILVRELGITALREAVRRSRVIPQRQRVIPASRAGKLKTGLQILAIGLYFLPASVLPGAVSPELLPIARGLVMVAAVAVTLVSGLDYVAKAWRMWRRARAHALSASAGAEEARDS